MKRRPALSPEARRRASAAAARAADKVTPVHGEPSAFRPRVRQVLTKIAAEQGWSVQFGGALAAASDREALRPALSGLARQARADNPGPQSDLEERVPVSDKQAAREAAATNIAADRLRSIVERVERLEEERKALASDIKDVFDEGKNAGFDVKVIRRLLRDRKRDPQKVEEEETLLDLYRRALGM